MSVRMMGQPESPSLAATETHGNSQSVVEKAWKKRVSSSTARRSLIWVAVQLVLIFVLYVDLSYSMFGNPFNLNRPLIRIIEITLCGIFICNIVYDCMNYVKYLLSGQVEVTLEQKRLLGVADQDSNFILSPKKPCLSPDGSNILFSKSYPGTSAVYSPSVSPYSSFGHATPTNMGSLSGSFSYASPNTSYMSPSPFSNMSFDKSASFTQGNLSGNMSFSPSIAYSPDQSMTSLDSSGIVSRLSLSTSFRSPSPSDKITDLQSLSQYIRDQEEKEHRASLASPDITFGNQSFWNYGRPAVDPFNHSLRKNQYQLASRSPQSHKSRSEDNDNIGGEVWRQLGITDDQLYVWIERLRKWLGNTILMKLAKEIDSVNASLRKIGCEDAEIGEVGVSHLKQLALTKGQYVPTLNVIVPYLDFSSNQEYLVKRIKELGSDGCISEFSWDRGGSGGIYGKPWKKHLPTDAGIVTHLFCCYMDSRLPADIKYIDGKTFTSQHFIKNPDKPNLEKDDNLLIYQSTTDPPHYQVVIKNTVFNLPAGRNNMFQALLFFLYQVKTKEKGMLGRVNLGMSGVNILTVFDD